MLVHDAAAACQEQNGALISLQCLRGKSRLKRNRTPPQGRLPDVENESRNGREMVEKQLRNAAADAGKSERKLFAFAKYRLRKKSG
jgi:hypothetical protein